MAKNLGDIKNVVDLSSVVYTLFQKLGFQSLEILENGVIKGVEESLLRNKEYKIFCFVSELNNKIPYVKDLISSHIEADDEIIIVTSHKKISNYFVNWISRELSTTKISTYNEARLIELIDQKLPEFWTHNDPILKVLEDVFLKKRDKVGELQKILNLDKKFNDLLNVFIEPKIFVVKQEKKDGRKEKSRIGIDKLATKGNYILTGDAGTGKSTLLGEIGQRAISQNNIQAGRGKPKLPILITPSLLQDSEYNLEKVLKDYFEKHIGTYDIESVLSKYEVILLIDSIDELNDELKNNLIAQLESYSKLNWRFILATRNYENLVKNRLASEHSRASISNFDINQVKQYLTSFFRTDLIKSENLWTSLKNHNVLDKIPPTPLTLSLISILYEENGYEIPATLTDIYDNFNSFLLGRLSVNTRLDFLTINVKEKVLGTYALKVIKSDNRERLKPDVFLKYIVDEFKKQAITVDDELFPDLTVSLTDGTGVLHINQDGYIDFQHDHFLEYYASREMFFDENRLKHEEEIIDRFTQYNWQNVAIFYTGRTKNMSNFLNNLLIKVDSYNILPEYLLGVSGLGYVLQSLWMTNVEDRKNAIIKSLELLLKADKSIKALSSSGDTFFKNINENYIAMINLAWFYNHYNSITLKEPLSLAFDQLHKQLSLLEDTHFTSDKVTLLYKLFCISATIKIGKEGTNPKMDILFNTEKLLNYPLFVFLFDFALENLDSEFKAELVKYHKLESKKKKYSETIRFYLNNTVDVLNNTNYEQLKESKKTEIFTEGKTDADIIRHAFKVLTQGKDPYWGVTEIEKNKTSVAGGAQQIVSVLSKVAKETLSEYDKEKTLIGLLDNDAKGYREFNGVKDGLSSVNDITKKFDDSEIFLLLLPIPNLEEYQSYNQDKQDFKFFEIEHYFSKDYLESHKMVEALAIDGVFEITGDKEAFKTEVLNEYNPKIFKNFVNLFNEIDNICNRDIQYIE